jgi:hypothetical protein
MFDLIYEEPESEEFDYDNALMLRLNLQCEDAAFEALVRRIGLDTGMLKAKDLTYLRVLLANLLRSHRQGKWLAISRDKNRYSPRNLPRRYNPNRISYRIGTRCVDALEDKGLIELKRGFIYRESGIGRCTRIRASKALCMQFATLDTKSRLTHQPRTEGIILRDKAKHPSDYRETEQTHRARRQLERINTQIASSQIDLPDGNTDAGQLVRIYNNGKFTHGGRFYGGNWQSLSKSERAKIRIDGMPVVEKDYRSLHLRMLYAQAGVPCPEDPYQIPGYKSEAGRKAMKAVSLTCLNAESRLSAIRAVHKQRRKDPEAFPMDFDVRSAIDAFIAHHEPIRDRMFSDDIGVRLQNLDANIANQVMLGLAEEGITVLPVHDSFIVGEQHEERLVQAMASAYRKVMGGEAAIHCIVSLFIAEIYRESTFLRTRASNHLLILDRYNKSLTLNLRPGRAPLLR